MKIKIKDIRDLFQGIFTFKHNIPPTPRRLCERQGILNVYHCRQTCPFQKSNISQIAMSLAPNFGVDSTQPR